MSNSLVVAPESRRRVRRSIMTFFGLSAPGVGTSIAVELKDPNAFSFSQSIMGVFDGVIAGTMLASEKLDAHGWHKSAQVGRAALSMAHIGVAGVGTVSTFERLQSPEQASTTSLGVSLGVAALSGAAILYERRRDKLGDVLRSAQDRYHELSRDMARRMFYTKLGESAFTAAGVTAALATTTDRPTTGIAAVAATGMFASVAGPMFAQVRDEWRSLSGSLRRNRRDELVESVAHPQATS